MTNLKTTKRALWSSIVALFMCFAMLLGSTYAWFTDSVTSSGNIIQTGELKVGMYYADGAKTVPAVGSDGWKDASKEAIFNNTLWEPGYTEAKHILIVNKGTLALNYRMRIVANGTVSKLADVIDVYCILGNETNGYQGATKVENRDMEALVKAGTAKDLGSLADILGTADNLSKTVNGMLLAGKNATLTLVLKMQETANNDYQNLSIGSDFRVELIATQAAYENDSFDDQYDAVVPSPELPAALVRPLDNLSVSYTTTFPNGTPAKDPMKLAAGYQFEPTESLEEANVSAYKHWHADYVVSADRDVPVNSVALAGYYSAFCKNYNNDNWVALMDPGSSEVLTAGDEIPLLGFIMGGYCVTYKDICQWGNDGMGFRCGLAALDAEALEGTTITVELRIYENKNNEWSDSSHDCDGVNYDGYYETIGTFKYTFPVSNKVETAEKLAEELAAGKSVALSEDIVVPSTLSVPANTNVDIDLNGHNLSFAVDNSGKAAAIINNKGNLKIFGEGTISFVAADPDLGAIPAYATNTITSTGNLVIGEGVVVTNGSDGGASYAVDVQSGSFVLDGGTLIGERCALRIARFNADTEFVMNSGKVIGATPAWIHLPGSDSNVAPAINVTINGGTFQSTKASSADNDVLYTYSFGNSHANTTLTINGGNFLGGTVSIGAGYKGDAPQLIIKGGTFEYDVYQWTAEGGFVLYKANQ